MGKGLDLSRAQKNNTMITGLIIVGLLLFLFLPDFVGFDWGVPFLSNNGSEHEVSILEDVRQAAQPLDHNSYPAGVEATDSSALAKLSREVDQGYIDLVGERARQKSAGESEGDITFSVQTWQGLHSKEGREHLTKARSQAQELAGKLRERNRRTRHALFNYIAGIDLILGNSSSDQFTATEAVEYLETLDRAVTRAMVTDGASRADRIDWSQVSLAPVLNRSRADALKQRAIPPFSPSIRLVYLRMYQPGVSGVDPRQPAYVEATFVVSGRDVRGIHLLRNGLSLYPDLLMEKIPYNEHDRKVMINWPIELHGRYSLLALAHDGSESQVVYDFSKALTAFKWQYSYEIGGVIPQMPFLLQDSTIPGRRLRYDPRLDAFFRRPISGRRAHVWAGKFSDFRSTSLGDYEFVAF